MDTPLLQTKLYIPRTTSNLVPRPRLLAQLNEGLGRALTIVAAPAGFGKTTLLGAWLSQAGEPLASVQATWLALDEGDNDPARFVSYLVAALQTVQPDVGQSTMALLEQAQTAGVSPDTAWLIPALTALVNDFTAQEAEVVLVLDDYHLITAAAVQQALIFLLNHLPPPLHLLIATRTEPPLPLAKLRARGQLLELGATELRFTPTEAATFLNQVMALDLSAEDIATLDSKTEGWITGLQLAALSMQGRADVSSFIAAFSGSHRHILDYLAAEVLSRQSEPVQSFLLRTSVLSRLSAPLGDVLLSDNREATSSQTTLEYLEKSNLFLFPLDDERRWYRYHHLFADFLRDRLQHRFGQPLVAALHQKAAAWFERNGLMAEATGHALAAADVERAARLIEQSGRTILRRSELATLLNWVAALPGESLRVRPRLSLYHAWALVLTGQFDAIEARLTDVEEEATEQAAVRPKPDINGEITAIRATVAYFQRDLEQAATLYRLALEQLPPENLFLRGAVAMSLATVYHLAGNLAQATWAFTEAGAIGQANDNLYTLLVAHLNLAHLQTEQAELHRARETYRRLVTRIGPEQEQNEDLSIAGRINIGLGQLLYQWNDLDGGTAQGTAGVAWAEQKGDGVTLVSGYLLRARIELARGQPQAAAEWLDRATTASQSYALSGWQVRLATQRVTLALGRADLDVATRWLQRAETSLHSDSPDDSAGFFGDLQRIERLARVRWLLAQEEVAAALELLTTLQQTAEAEQRTGLLIELRLLQAISHQAQNDLSQAATRLEQALALAEPAGYVRLFLDEGESVAELLRYALSRRLTTHRVYADTLLQAFKKEPSPDRPISPPPLIDPLSDRELEILGLIGEGLSNRQIAERLVLTVGTVKWHINNIYGKLGVRRRTQALARARELHLL